MTGGGGGVEWNVCPAAHNCSLIPPQCPLPDFTITWNMGGMCGLFAQSYCVCSPSPHKNRIRTPHSRNSLMRRARGAERAARRFSRLA